MHQQSFCAVLQNSQTPPHNPSAKSLQRLKFHQNINYKIVSLTTMPLKLHSLHFINSSLFNCQDLLFLSLSPVSSFILSQILQCNRSMIYGFYATPTLCNKFLKDFHQFAHPSVTCHSQYFPRLSLYCCISLNTENWFFKQNIKKGYATRCINICTIHNTLDSALQETTHISSFKCQLKIYTQTDAMGFHDSQCHVPIQCYVSIHSVMCWCHCQRF